LRRAQQDEQHATDVLRGAEHYRKAKDGCTQVPPIFSSRKPRSFSKLQSYHSSAAVFTVFSPILHSRAQNTDRQTDGFRTAAGTCGL